MEWPVSLRKVGSDEFYQADFGALNRIASLVSKLGSTPHNSEFLMNGARCYRDDRLLEYATGEDDSFKGTVANEIAGEQLLSRALRHYVTEREDIEDYRLQKRVLHAEDVTGGYHINLCGDATTFNLTEDGLYDLGLWAATCSMYTGAGAVYETAREGAARLVVAQKTTVVKRGFSTTTTSAKPLICLRDEPHGDPSKFHRVQIVGIDPNISPWASWMALGTASLCLRAIEQRRTGRSLRLQKTPTVNGANEEPLAKLARAVASNPQLNAIATLQDGSTISALDIQRELYLQAEQTDHTDEEAEVLQNWKKVLDDIKGDRSFLVKKAGWTARHESLRKYAAKRGLSDTDNALLAADRAWDLIKDDGVAEKLRNSRWREDMPAAELIRDRRDNPCPNTRAILRRLALRESIQYKHPSSISWSSYRHYAQPSIRLKDPLMTSVPEPEPSDSRYHEPDDEDEGEYHGNGYFLM
jgi:proteasome accessory factor A